MSVNESIFLFTHRPVFQVILEHDSNIRFRMILECLNSFVDGPAIDLLLLSDGIVLEGPSKCLFREAPFGFWNVPVEIFCLEIGRVRWSLGYISLCNA